MSDIRRYGGDSAYVDSEYRVKRSMDQIKEKLGNEFEELTDTMELATPEQFSRSKRQTTDSVRINPLPQVKWSVQLQDIFKKVKLFYFPFFSSYAKIALWKKKSEVSCQQ